MKKYEPFENYDHMDQAGQARERLGMTDETKQAVVAVLADEDYGDSYAYVNAIDYIESALADLHDCFDDCWKFEDDAPTDDKLRADLARKMTVYDLNDEEERIQFIRECGYEIANLWRILGEFVVAYITIAEIKEHGYQPYVDEIIKLYNS